MQKKILYRVMRPDGGVDITPQKPINGTYTETFRLIADDGKVLTDGVNVFMCIDTNAPELYSEIEGKISDSYDDESDN